MKPNKSVRMQAILFKYDRQQGGWMDGWMECWMDTQIDHWTDNEMVSICQSAFEKEEQAQVCHTKILKFISCFITMIISQSVHLVCFLTK